MEVLLFVVLAVLVGAMLYMPIIWTNGYSSKKRIFCIKKYDEKFSSHPYKVCWRFTWAPFTCWHEYVTDSHYMFTAEFDTMKEAQEFINLEYDYMFNKKDETIKEVPYSR